MSTANVSLDYLSLDLGLCGSFDSQHRTERGSCKRSSCSTVWPQMATNANQTERATQIGPHQAREADTSIWGMSMCGLAKPVCRPSGPLPVLLCTCNRGLRPRQRMFKPSGLNPNSRISAGDPLPLRLCALASLRFLLPNSRISIKASDRTNPHRG